jgi:hypothetical protein
MITWGGHDLDAAQPTNLFNHPGQRQAPGEQGGYRCCAARLRFGDNREGVLRGQPKRRELT